MRLSGVPRVGDKIWRRNGPSSPSLIVEHVQWVELPEGECDDACVIVSVRERAD